MIRASIYGRLGADPVERQTRNGKPMATGSIAVDAGRDGADAETAWFSLIAFGRAAETLLRHSKGDLLAAMGVLTKSHYTDRNGAAKEQWTLAAESILSARTVRPKGRKPKPSSDSPAAKTTADALPFNDPLPW